MEITIYAGEKTRLNDEFAGRNSATFQCEMNEIDKAYDALAEDLVLTGFPVDDIDWTKEQEQELNDFQDLRDDNVKVMLEDAKKQGFISDYDIKKGAKFLTTQES